MNIKGVGWDLGGTLSPRLTPILDRLVKEELSEFIGDERCIEVAADFRRDEARYWERSPVGTQPRASAILINVFDRYQIPGAIHLAEVVLKRVEARFTSEIAPAEFVTDSLERFARAGIKLAVLSNWMYDCSWIISWMAKQGLTPFFSCVRCSADMAFRKPHRLAFIDICTGLSLGPSDMAFVGNDILEDIDGSLSAGFAASVLVGGEADMIGPLRERYPGRRIARADTAADVFEALS